MNLYKYWFSYDMTYYIVLSIINKYQKKLHQPHVTLHKHGKQLFQNEHKNQHYKIESWGSDSAVYGSGGVKRAAQALSGKLRK